MWLTLKENCHIDEIVKMEDLLRQKEKELQSIEQETTTMGTVIYNKDSALR